MLFKNQQKSFQFRLTGLSLEETGEISKLITDNGGVVCGTSDSPVMTFGNSDTIRRPGEPLFHVNYVRDCVRQQQLLQLVHYMIGPPGHFGCLQCILTRGKNVCQFHYDGPLVLHRDKKTTVSPPIDRGLISDDDSSSATEDRVSLATTSRKASPKGNPRQRKGKDIRKIKRSRALSRLIISKEEQYEMVQYLIDNKMISQGKAMRPWNKMVEDGLTWRSPETLRGHFRRLLLPKIKRFSMRNQHLKQFQKLLNRNNP